MTRSKRLRCRNQTPAAFIEKGRHRRKPLSNGFDIDHHHNIWYEKSVVNPYLTLSKVDSIISGRALRLERVRYEKEINYGLAVCALVAAGDEPGFDVAEQGMDDREELAGMGCFALDHRRVLQMLAKAGVTTAIAGK